MKLLIKNGFLISNSYYGKYDIEVEKDKIINISSTILPTTNHRVIDATNKTVIPGLIDAHVHFGLKGYGSETLENFYSGSRTALLSGITTVIDYIIPQRKENLIQAFRRKLSEAKKSFVDYSFHSQIVDFCDDTPNQIKYIINCGIKSFKIFLPRTEGWYINDEKFILEAHCEDSDVIEPLIKKLEKQKKLNVKYFPLSRPNMAEYMAVKRFLEAAKKFTTSVYVVHISTKEAINEIVFYKNDKNKKFDLYAEICPQYLSFTQDVFNSNKNYLYTCCPTIKTSQDRDVLWENVKKGFIDVIATDNCVFSKKEKYRYRKDFRKIPMGLPGTTVLLYKILTEGIKRKISLRKLINCFTYNPAKIFGLY
ncbi:MAG: amidohydrolase family protein, partial [Endomicrobiia bacterium]